MWRGPGPGTGQETVPGAAAKGTELGETFTRLRVCLNPTTVTTCDLTGARSHPSKVQSLEDRGVRSPSVGVAPKAARTGRAPPCYRGVNCWGWGTLLGLLVKLEKRGCKACCGLCIVAQEGGAASARVLQDNTGVARSPGIDSSCSYLRFNLIRDCFLFLSGRTCPSTPCV